MGQPQDPERIPRRRRQPCPCTLGGQSNTGGEDPGAAGEHGHACLPRTQGTPLPRVTVESSESSTRYPLVADKPKGRPWLEPHGASSDTGQELAQGPFETPGVRSGPSQKWLWGQAKGPRVLESRTNASG